MGAVGGEIKYRVHAHGVAVVKLPRSRLEEHLLALVEQLDHVLCLEQAELLLVVELLREPQLETQE